MEITQLNLLMIIFLSTILIILFLLIIIYRIFFAKDRLKDIEEKHSQGIEKINNDSIEKIEKVHSEILDNFESNGIKLHNHIMQDLQNVSNEISAYNQELLQSMELLDQQNNTIRNLQEENKKFLATIKRKNMKIERLENASRR